MSSFELDLKTGKLYTFSQPPEDIGIACQADMFDNDLLQDQFRARASAMTLGDREEELERIPIIKKPHQSQTPWIPQRDPNHVRSVRSVM